jgi:hypothetical protein
MEINSENAWPWNQLARGDFIRPCYVPMSRRQDSARLKRRYARFTRWRRRRFFALLAVIGRSGDFM